MALLCGFNCWCDDYACAFIRVKLRPTSSLMHVTDCALSVRLPVNKQDIMTMFVCTLMPVQMNYGPWACSRPRRPPGPNCYPWTFPSRTTPPWFVLVVVAFPFLNGVVLPCLLCYLTHRSIYGLDQSSTLAKTSTSKSLPQHEFCW